MSTTALTDYIFKRYEDFRTDPLPAPPPRKSGELRFAVQTIPPGQTACGEMLTPCCFWPERFRVESDSNLDALFLRGICLGVTTIYPDRHRLKPMYCSRAEGAAINDFRLRHGKEGCPVQEAMQHSIEGHVLGPDTHIQWEFENKSSDPITFTLVIEGSEVA